MESLESVRREYDTKKCRLTGVDVLGDHFPELTRKLDSSRSSSTNDEAQ